MVDSGVNATLFNVLREEVQSSSDMTRRPLKDLPEIIEKNYGSDDRIQNSQNSFVKFARFLRSRNSPVSSLEAVSFLNGWDSMDVWSMVSTIFRLVASKGLEKNTLYLKNLASRIGEEKNRVGVHNPNAIRLLMNVQTVLDGSKDFRQK